jgi:hypothetical protein
VLAVEAAEAPNFEAAGVRQRLDLVVRRCPRLVAGLARPVVVGDRAPGDAEGPGLDARRVAQVVART